MIPTTVTSTLHTIKTTTNTKNPIITTTTTIFYHLVYLNYCLHFYCYIQMYPSAFVRYFMSNFTETQSETFI